MHARLHAAITRYRLILRRGILHSFLAVPTKPGQHQGCEFLGAPGAWLTILPLVDQHISGKFGLWQPQAFAICTDGRSMTNAARAVPANGDLQRPLAARFA